MGTMNEKVAMVTGAAAGIGLASAEAFAKAGATVVLVDINEPKEQAGKLVSEGYKAVAYRCNVSDTQAVKEMIDWIVATYGRLDAALNNAGIQTPQRPMAEITDEEFDRTVAVDLKGVWNCMRYEIIQIAETRWWRYCQYLVSRRCYGLPRTSGLYRLQACGDRSDPYGCHRLLGKRDSYQCHLSGCNPNTYGRRTDTA